MKKRPEMEDFKAKNSLNNGRLLKPKLAPF